ncbi:hypothetical protein SNOG_16192 [Parastagonospora nodorum SN15]|uniref:Uncharacterized protein n=1 Tax=Phaeosphaeria nodorum (strain SN15 / ATCC MYA-4574 / FGSC 10173) TaxID=321614 RepID=Q0TW73_PHANO|nr:hypothetical protein SNOG_16192 [Parastagonospora nodorum SN15]EAT76376.1 hypothetical protein SNOG_16192 [Parastagonospora nodorum SN15]
MRGMELRSWWHAGIRNLKKRDQSHDGLVNVPAVQQSCHCSMDYQVEMAIGLQVRYSLAGKGREPGKCAETLGAGNGDQRAQPTAQLDS